MTRSPIARQVCAWLALLPIALGGCREVESPAPFEASPAAATAISIEALVAPGTSSMALGASSGGQVVGSYSGTCAGPSYWDAAGALVTLPVPAGYCGGSTRAINEAGSIAGHAYAGASVAARWTPGDAGYQVELLGPGPHAGTVSVWGIDEQGHVLGNESTGSGPLPMIWSPGAGWAPLALPPGATDCEAHGMSGLGAVVGRCVINSLGEAVYWADASASPVVLPRLAGSNGGQNADGINNPGTVVGVAGNTQRKTTTSTAVRWSLVGGSWQVTALGTLGGDSRALDVDDAGSVVGWSYPPASGKKAAAVKAAVVWLDGTTIVNLGALSSGGESLASGVSPTGRIAVGWSVVGGSTKATRWRF